MSQAQIAPAPPAPASEPPTSATPPKLDKTPSLAHLGLTFFERPRKKVPTNTAADTSPAGVLIFTLHSGADLVSADSNGLSDPYCMVKVPCNAVWRSRVIKRTLDPVWEHRHEFEGLLADLTSQPVRIRVYDHDVVSLNDPIGTCAVRASAIRCRAARRRRRAPRRRAPLQCRRAARAGARRARARARRAA